MSVYQVTHDWGSDGSISYTIVEAISAASGQDPTEIGQLSDAVDPDALDALFRPLDGEPVRTDGGRVEFSHDGFDVTVAANGTVTVRPSGEGSRDGVTTGAAFQDELVRLLREAEANGVDVEGGWASRDGAERPEWGIEIYEVRRANG